MHIADLFDNGQETESETLNSNDNDRTGKEVSQGDRVQREGDSEERTRGENRQGSDGVLPKEPAARAYRQEREKYSDALNDPLDAYRD